MAQNVELIFKARDDTKAALRSLNAALKELDKNAKGIGDNAKVANTGIGGITKSLGGLGGAVAAVGIGAMVKGLFDLGAAAVGAAADLEKNLRNVRSLAPQAESSIQDLTAAVVEMSKKVPQSVQELSLGLYDVRSSGFAGKEGLDILEIAAKGASAGLSSTATSVKGLTAIMNAYGLKTGPEATRVMDVMFQTVNRGVITFDELAQNIGDVTSISALLKVPIEEVGAGFAVLTRNGINAAESSTALSSLMRSMLNPSAEAAKAAKRLGIEWDANALKSKGLNGVLADMIEKTKGNETEMATLAGDARAIKAAFILAKEGGKEFNDELAIMQGATGATDAALAEQAKSFDFQAKILKNNVDAIKIAIGNELLPILTDMAKKFSEFLNSEGFKGFIQWLKDNKTLVKDVAIVIGVTLVAVLVGLAAAFVAAHAAAFIFAAVIAAIVIQVAAAIAWFRKAKEIREAIEKNILGAIKMLAEEAPKKFKEFKDKAVAMLTKAWDAIKLAFSTAIQWLVDQIVNMPEHLAFAAGMVFKFFVKLFTDWIPAVGAAYTKFMTELPGKIATAAQNMWTMSVAFFTQTATNIINWAINTKNAVIAWFQALPGAIATMATNLWAGAVNGFIAFKDSAIAWAQETFNAIVAWFKNLPGAIAGAAKSGATGLWENIKSKAGSIAGAAKSGFQSFADGGMVQGALGSPQLVMAHAGETVLPTHKQGGMEGWSGGAPTVNITGPISINNGMDVDAFGDRLARRIYRQRNGG